MSEGHHVVSFGAVGNGIADDTSALQAAFDSGQDVVLGESKDARRYLVNSPLVITTSAQTIRGIGQYEIAAGSGLSGQSGASGAVVRVRGNDESPFLVTQRNHVFNLRIDGSSIAESCLYMGKQARQFVFDGMRLRRATNGLFGGSDNWINVFTDFDIDGCTNGINQAGTNHTTWIMRNGRIRNGTTGIVGWCFTHTMTAVSFEDLTTAIEGDQFIGVVRHCDFERCKRLVNANGASWFDLTLLGPWIDEYGDAGLALFDIGNGQCRVLAPKFGALTAEPATWFDAAASSSHIKLFDANIDLSGKSRTGSGTVVLFADGVQSSI